MQADQHKTPNFSESFRKTAAKVDNLSETKKQDLERIRYLKALLEEQLQEEAH